LKYFCYTSLYHILKSPVGNETKQNKTKQNKTKRNETKPLQQSFQSIFDTRIIELSWDAVWIGKIISFVISRSAFIQERKL